MQKSGIFWFLLILGSMSERFDIILCIFLVKISGKNSSLKNATAPTKENIFFLKIRDKITLNA